MPGTDAVPYMHARAPGVVDHPSAPVARAESCCAETLRVTVLYRRLELAQGHLPGTLAHVWGVCRAIGLELPLRHT